MNEIALSMAVPLLVLVGLAVLILIVHARRSATRRPSLLSEAIFLGCAYFATYVVCGLTYAGRGPGSGFLSFSIFAVASSALMLRRPPGSRLFCCIVLLFAIYGMWHEKEAGDSAAVGHVRQILDAEMAGHSRNDKPP